MDLNTGLIGHWKFDEGSGTTASDSSGNGYNGTLVNGPVWEAGGVLSFDGVNDYVDLGDIDAFEFGPEDRFTIYVWLRASGIKQGVQNIIGRFNNSVDAETYTWQLYSKQSELIFKIGDGISYNQKLFDNLPSDLWMHIAIVVGKQGENINFYGDGVLLESNSIKRTVGQLTRTANPFRISDPSSSGTVLGAIAEAGIYNRALTQEEINTLTQRTQYGLNVKSKRGSVTVTPDYLLYDSGSQVTLTAIQTQFLYPFGNWSGDIIGNENPVTITMDRDKTITANFLPNVPAFPGAEGFGSYATGGRGGQVMHVTRLDDVDTNGNVISKDNYNSWNNPMPGTLRWALKGSEPRIIVFDVGGVIELKYELYHGSNFYLAGQTAPGGITISGAPAFKDNNWGKPYRTDLNAIIRHIRARGVQNFNIFDSSSIMSFTNYQNFILDHVSVTAGADTIFAILKSTDYTLQWSSIEESPLWGQAGNQHTEGSHNYGITVNAYSPDDESTLHHSLIANHYYRMPNTGRGFLGGIDYRNNLVYNWQLVANTFNSWGKVKEGSKFAHFNVVNNNYVVGPSVLYENAKKSVIGTDKAYFYPPNFTGNLWFKELDPSAAPLDIPVQSMASRDGFIFQDDPWPAPPVTTESAMDAYNSALDKVGAWPRDATTRRTVAEIRTRTGGIGLRGPFEHFPERRGPTSIEFDTDRDGMPDDWETSHGLNPNNAEDRNNIVPAGVSFNDRHKGYAYIEYYINELADNIVGQSGITYTIQTNVSPSDAGTVLPQYGNYDWEPEHYGGYNAPYWFGNIDFGRAEYNEGSTVTIKAKPKEGYVFDHWQGGPVDGLTSTQVSFPAISNADITAVFRPLTDINVNISVSIDNAGEVAGAGNYKQGEVATLSAYSNAGYKFKRWVGGPLDGLTNPNVQFIAQEDLNITAEFESGDGGDVLIDDFNDRDVNSTLTTVSGVPKQWKMSAVSFYEVSPGNFAVKGDNQKYGSLELGVGDSYKPNLEFDIPNDTTVIKMKLYNLGNVTATAYYKSPLEGGYFGGSGMIQGEIVLGYGTRWQDYWKNWLYYSRPFRFPAIEPGGAATASLPIKLLRNDDLTRITEPASNNLRKLSLLKFFAIYNTTIAIDDVAFGRSGVDEATLPNLPPVANAGRDQITKDVDRDGKEIVLLNGLKSYDGNAGLIKTWSWKENNTQIATGFAPSVELSVGIHNIELTITDEGELSSTDTVTITVLEKGTEPPPTLPGDVNNDGKVDILDLVIVARAFGSASGDANWDARADLNGDGTIDITDLVTVALNFGRGV